MTAPTMTADAAEIVRLAGRVEQATGPDRELDCLIWATVEGLSVVWTGADGHLLIIGDSVIGSVDPGVNQRNFTCNRRETGPNSIPAYTASLDAAMTLVPKGWKVHCIGESEYVVDLSRPWMAMVVERGADLGSGHTCYATTAALALASSALRARAAQHDYEVG